MRAQHPGSNRRWQLSFRADGMLMVVCNEAIYAVKFPGLAHKRVVNLPAATFETQIEACAFGPGVVAVGNNDGKVRVFDTSSWKELRSHDLGGKRGELRSLAFSPDGSKLAASRRDNPVVVIEGGRVKPVAGFEHSGGAIALSPDGSRLFGEIRYFAAAEVSLVDGFIHNAKRVGSWLTVARYISKDLIVTSGSDGLALFAVGQGETVMLDEDTAEGLAVSADGAMICGGTRDERINCFVRQGSKVEPSTYAIP